MFDLVVVGGGMVGATLACALSKQMPGLSVAIVESVKYTGKSHPGFDGRSIALSYGSKEILEKLELWQDLASSATPINHIHVSDRGHSGMVTLDHTEYQLDALGYVVELADSGRVLHNALAQLPKLNWFCPDSLTQIQQLADKVVLTLSSGKVIESRLVIGADGGLSKCRQLLNLPTEVTDYGTSAIIANVETSELHQNRAFERFTQSGPLALLPMSSNRSSLVWSVDNTELEQIMELPERAFLQALQQAFGFRMGRFIRSGQRFSFPLKLVQTHEPVHHRVVCIGNAAHTLHPIAGQGYNLGLRDVFVLVEIIKQAQATGADIGCFNTLNRYWQQRRSDHHTTIAMTNTLAQVFANQLGPLVWGRNCILHLMGLSQLLKAPLAKQALGKFNLFPVHQ